jgi:hypothetical protein
MIKYLPRTFLFLVSIFNFPSCSYKLGLPLADSGSFHLHVRNNSMAPILGPKLDRELRKKIIHNGTFTLVSYPEDADMFIIVTISNYDDTLEAFRPNDSLLALGLNLGVTARVQVRDQRDHVFKETQVRANASVHRPESTRLPEESSSLQSLAEELASNIHLSLLNQAW